MAYIYYLHNYVTIAYIKSVGMFDVELVQLMLIVPTIQATRIIKIL